MNFYKTAFAKLVYKHCETVVTKAYNEHREGAPERLREMVLLSREQGEDDPAFMDTQLAAPQLLVKVKILIY